MKPGLGALSIGVGCCAMMLAGHAAAAATLGGTVSMGAGLGLCRDDRLVPLDTAQDSFALSGAASCGGGSVSADVKGDAATASIGLRASAVGNGSGSSQTAASVQFRDRWDITAAPGTGFGSVTVPVTLHLDGSISPSAVFHPGFGRFLDYNLSFGQPNSFNVFSAVGSVSAVGTFSQTFTGSVVLPYGAGQPLQADVILSLSVPGLLEGNVDFYNSASVSVLLPTGYVVRNSSGLQLFAAPVPEPATLPMLACGLAVILGLSGARSIRSGQLQLA